MAHLAEKSQICKAMRFESVVLPAFGVFSSIKNAKIKKE